MSLSGKRVFLVVNTDAFFLSHRRALGLALRDAGARVTVVAGESPDGHREILKDGHGFVSLPVSPGGRNPLREAGTLAFLGELYARHRPDVVHHVTIKPVLYGSVVARALRIPTINAVSGLGYVFIPQPGDPLSQRAIRALALRAYETALSGPRTRTIFQNPDDLRTFVEGRLVPEGQAVLIRGSGVDLGRFAPTPLPEGAPLVVLPARVLWDKGVRELVEAARVVRRARPDVRFALVGGNDTENPARVPTETLRGWEKEGVVEWWGHRTDMPEVLKQATLVVLPSYREGLPLALAEAAAAGRPAITTDVPGCREAVREGETGWLVPPKDAPALATALSAALADPAELARRGARARTFAERELGREAVLQATLRVYDELLVRG